MKIETVGRLIAVWGVVALAGGCASRHEVSDETLDRLAITNKDTLSAASKRAIERGYDQGPQWYVEFRSRDLKGDLAYERGMIRRDPSDIITVDGTYYVYYTKSTGKTYGFGTGDPEKRSSRGTSPRFGTPPRRTVGTGRSRDWRLAGGRRGPTTIDRSSRRR